MIFAQFTSEPQLSGYSILNYLLTSFFRNLKKKEQKIMKKIFFAIILLAGTLVVTAQAYKGRDYRSDTDKLNDMYCTGLFKTAEGTILDMANENAQGYFNILDWLDGRVAGLQVWVSRTGIRIPVIRGSQARIFIDEIPTDAGFLNMLPVSDIAMIKVIKTPFAGSIGGNSAVVIYRLRGEEDELK
jgi:hypothetical protein